MWELIVVIIHIFSFFAFAILVLMIFFNSLCQKRPKISILIPFASKDPYRKEVFKWLLEYWKHELPDAEIIVGHSYGKVFCKAEAFNNAFNKSSGRVIAIMDADAYIEGKILEKAADKILENLDNHLWFVPYRHLYRLNKEITAEILCSDPNKPLRIVCPPPKKQLDDDGQKSGYGHRFGAMLMIFPREATEFIGCFDERMVGWGCTDEKTEILTNNGWKKYTDLSVGELVLTLNHNTGFSEWKPIQKINVFNGHHKMISAESRTHSSLTTLNHRWAVIDRYGKRLWKTSDTLNSHDRIPVAAECADLPTNATHTDDLVSLIGWFWTEGHITENKGVIITQSQEVHKKNCSMIEESLIKLFGSEVVGKHTKNDIEPHWHRSGDNFILNPVAGKILQDLAPNKVPSFEFLLSLTKTQLELFIQRSMLGDGATNPNNSGKMEQKNPLLAERFAFALILSGRGVSIRERGTLAKRTKFEYFMTVVEMQLGKLRGIVPVTRKTPRGIDGTFERTTLDGVVWCPTVENSTWLARRNGKVYFTGNSEDICLLRSLDTLWGKHKTLNECIFHLWHPFIGKDYRSRKWEGQERANLNERLANRYNDATRKPTKMRKLIDEGCEYVRNKHWFWRGFL